MMKKTIIRMHMFKCLSLLFLITSSFSTFLYAQETSIVTGKVIDASNSEPLINVTIMEKGTQNGTVTDANGEYSIEVGSGAVLNFSYIGFLSEEVPVGLNKSINVSLIADITSLDDVVVVGYSTTIRKNITSSVASADMENLSKRTTSNVAEALQGNVTGVQISYQDGTPGAPVNLNIRGFGTLGVGSNQPLVIVDGVQVTGLQYNNMHNTNIGDFGAEASNGLENINPNDIESIEILKDASASAIYGSRAANGVILVTTKRGKKGKPTIEYNGKTGVQMMRSGPEMTNIEQYIGILQKMYGEDLSGSPDVPQAAKDYLTDPTQFKAYDWYNELHNPAFTQSHDLSASGSNDMGSFRISTGYKKQDGVVIGTGYERANIRLNSDFNVSERLKIGQSFSGAKSKTKLESFPYSRSVLWNSISLQPYFPFDEPYTSYWGGPNFNETNAIRWNDFFTRKQTTDNLNANIYFQYEIIKGLKYRINGAYSSTQVLIKERERYAVEFPPGKNISEAQVTSSNWNIDNLLTYANTFGKHNVDLLAGYVAQEFIDKGFSASKSQFISPTTSTLDGPGGKLPAAGGDESRNRLNSFIGKASYTYDDRYLVTFNFRRDGSSRFAPENRWGNFPGFSAAWRVTEESFMSFSSHYLSELKVRAGYGVLGRQNIGNYDYTPMLEHSAIVVNGNLTDGLVPGTMVNRNVSWEELISKNIGVDFGFLDFKFSGTFDYFDNKTAGMIIQIPLAPSVGGGSIIQNSGEISNKGYEFSLNYKEVVSRDFNFKVGVNASHVKTVFNKIGVDQYTEFDGSVTWDVPMSIQLFEGGGPSEFWLIQTDGIFKSQEEIDNHISSDGTVIQPNAKPGDIKFIDYNDDGKITEDGDRQLMGSGVPKLNVGFNINAEYKNFDLTLNLYGAFGHYVYNGQKFQIEQTNHFANFSTALLDAYDPVDNPNSSFPRLNPNDNSENWNSRPTSDRYLEKGDFVKVSNIELGYNIPSIILDYVNIPFARIYLSAQNPFIITKYSGIDPEQGRNGIFNSGIDRGTSPQVRTFLAGLDIRF